MNKVAISSLLFTSISAQYGVWRTPLTPLGNGLGTVIGPDPSAGTLYPLASIYNIPIVRASNLVTGGNGYLYAVSDDTTPYLYSWSGADGSVSWPSGIQTPTTLARMLGDTAFQLVLSNTNVLVVVGYNGANTDVCGYDGNLGDQLWCQTGLPLYTEVSLTSPSSGNDVVILTSPTYVDVDVLTLDPLTGTATTQQITAALGCQGIMALADGSNGFACGCNFEYSLFTLTYVPQSYCGFNIDSGSQIFQVNIIMDGFTGPFASNTVAMTVDGLIVLDANDDGSGTEQLQGYSVSQATRIFSLNYPWPTADIDVETVRILGTPAGMNLIWVIASDTFDMDGYIAVVNTQTQAFLGWMTTSFADQPAKKDTVAVISSDGLTIYMHVIDDLTGDQYVQGVTFNQGDNSFTVSQQFPVYDSQRYMMVGPISGMLTSVGETYVSAFRNTNPTQTPTPSVSPSISASASASSSPGSVILISPTSTPTPSVSPMPPSPSVSPSVAASPLPPLPAPSNRPVWSTYVTPLGDVYSSIRGPDPQGSNPISIVWSKSYPKSTPLSNLVGGSNGYLYAVVSNVMGDFEVVALDVVTGNALTGNWPASLPIFNAEQFYLALSDSGYLIVASESPSFSSDLFVIDSITGSTVWSQTGLPRLKELTLTYTDADGLNDVVLIAQDDYLAVGRLLPSMLSTGNAPLSYIPTPNGCGELLSSPDGTLLICGCHFFEPIFSDIAYPQQICAFNIATAQPVWNIVLSNEGIGPFFAQTMSITPDGQIFVDVVDYYSGLETLMSYSIANNGALNYELQYPWVTQDTDVETIRIIGTPLGANLIWVVASDMDNLEGYVGIVDTQGHSFITSTSSSFADVPSRVDVVAVGSGDGLTIYVTVGNFLDGTSDIEVMQYNPSTQSITIYSDIICVNNMEYFMPGPMNGFLTTYGSSSSSSNIAVYGNVVPTPTPTPSISPSASASSTPVIPSSTPSKTPPPTRSPSPSRTAMATPSPTYNPSANTANSGYTPTQLGFGITGIILGAAALYWILIRRGGLAYLQKSLGSSGGARPSSSGGFLPGPSSSSSSSSSTGASSPVKVALAPQSTRAAAASAERVSILQRAATSKTGGAFGSSGGGYGAASATPTSYANQDASLRG
jgi:hypothetical protein